MTRTALEVMNDIADALAWQQLETIEGTISEHDRKLLRILNRVLRTLAGVDNWPFLRAAGEIITPDDYQLGVAEVTNGSTAVTGIDDPDTTATDPPVWTSAMIDRAFAISGENLVYRITDVPTATSLTLNRAYQGTTGTGANAKSYFIAQDRYAAPLDFDRPIEHMTSFAPGGSSSRVVEAIDPNALRRLRRQRGTVMRLDEPEAYTVWGADTQEEHRVIILDPFPDDAYTITFEYQRTHPEIKLDTDKILFPIRFDPLIIEACLYLGRRDVESDVQAQAMLVDFLRERQESMSKVELTTQLPRFKISQHMRRRENSRWGRSTRRIDYGSRFDDVHFFRLR